MSFVHRSLRPAYLIAKALIILGISESTFAENYSTWTNSRSLILNTTSTGANVSSNVRNYPLLVRLNPGTFKYFSETEPGGADIRFSKSDGTHLAYQIERWADHSSNNDTAEIWIKIDTLYGNQSNQYIKMYWGKTGATDSSNSAAVFASSNGFLAVYHLAGDLDDASGNSNDGTEPEGTVDKQASGSIGMASYFNGSSYFQAGDLPDRASGTISFWFTPKTTFNSAATATQGIWGKTVGESYNGIISLRGSDFNYGGSGSTGAVQTKIENNNTSAYNHSTTSSFTAGTWYYVVWRWGSSSASLYINGILEHSIDSCKTLSGDVSDEIGRAYFDPANFSSVGTNVRYFTGTLDEFRIANTMRDVNWIKLSYENQKTGQKLVSLVDTLKTLITDEPNDTTVPVGSKALFSVTAEGEGTLGYRWLRYPATPSGFTAICTLTSVAPADTGARFRCIVRDDYGFDSSRWAKLTVIDTPRITSQPQSVTADTGAATVFSVVVKDTLQLTYSWRKSGSQTVLGTSSSLTITSVVPADSGGYYCIITNPAATIPSDTARLTLNVARPDAAFSFTPATGAVPLTVTFTDASTGVITSRYWDFGDNSSAIATNPVHRYTDTGSYTVTLIVNGPGGTDTLIQTSAIKADAQSPSRPDAAFSFTPAIGTVPLVVTFTDASTGEITSRYWDFGDNSSATTANPVHTYTYAGTYTVKLIVNGPSGTDTLIQTSVIRVEAEPLSRPVAAFSCMPTTGTVPLAVTFTDASGGEITSYNWNFGDNSSSTAANPVHTYTDAGTYSVTLIVNGPGGADTLTKDNLVHGTAQPVTVNSVIIDTAYFDSLSASIRISWHFDPTVLNSYPEVGITYSFISSQINPVGTNIVGNISPSTEAEITLLEPIRFGATYYIALWFRLGTGEWIEPTVYSRCQVQTGTPYREIISFFDSSKTRDTITAFNGSIIFRKDSTYTTKKLITDTIELITPSKPPNGMIQAGTPFIFKKGNRTLPFFVGIHIDTIPKGRSCADVRLYSDSAGGYRVDHTTIIDTVNMIAYIKTGELSRSFFAMFDTMPPIVTSYAPITAPVTDASVIKDSIGIVDNITNTRWKYMYGSGSEVPVLHAQGDLSATASKFSLTINDAFSAGTATAGLRVMLITDDGAHVDTLNLSRCAYTAVSDSMTTRAHQWTPLYATTVLDNKDPDSLIAKILRFNNLDVYDNRYLRLFRWISHDGNKQDSEKWVEYYPTNDNTRSLFTLEPGRIMWLKTLLDVPVHLNAGHTLPLDDILTVDLPPKQWTDFGMPYQFGIRMEEILSATGTYSDSLQVYKWTKDISSGTYAMEPFYVPGMADKSDRTVTVDYTSRSGYGIYNYYVGTVHLRIPPVPTSMANLKKATASSLNASSYASCWSAKFIVQSEDSAQFPAVYFGYAPDIINRTYPIAPSFSTLRMAIVDRTTSQQCGHYISAEAKNGLIKELLISNNGDSAHQLRYHIEHAGAFPKDFTAYCYNADVKEIDTSGTIQIAPYTSVSRWIIVGDATFKQGFISTVAPQHYSLHPLYPNPARSALTIRYSVPFGASERITITIYNILGKKIWDQRISRLATDGVHTVTWNGRDVHGTPARSGLYIIRFTVQNESGKVIYHFERHATLLK